jgi:hypothetical protein
MAAPDLKMSPTTGGASSSTLSSWAGPYVTNMLGKAQAIANEPYQVYQGPMTAGESGLQSKVFQGLGNLSFPSNLGQSFSSSGAYQPPQMNMGAYQPQPIGTGPQPGGTYEDYLNDIGDLSVLPQTRQQFDAEQKQLGQQRQQGMDMLGRGNMGEIMAGLGGPGQMPQGGLAGLAGMMPPQPQQPQGVAQQYMNPYLESVLTPQMEELRRQNDITNMKANAGLTSAGAFGGGRQAIMNAENNRNLMQEMNKTVGQGYANAYDKAMQQFNTEQGQAKTLADMMSEAGDQQRGIEQQGISADYNEFLAQRDDPMKKTQYLQSMLQGLPISTVTNTAAQQSGLGNLVSSIGGMGSIMDSLKKFKLT